MSKVAGTLEFTDLGEPRMFYDPYPRFAQLRNSAPVSWAKAPDLLRGSGGYMVTRYEDVLALYGGDEQFSTDILTHTSLGKFAWVLPPTIRMLMQTMVFKDDPDHKRLRTLVVHRAFTPKRVSGLAPDIAKIAEQLADEIAAKPEVDLVHEFAIRLPLSVIATLLGVADEDRDRFHRLVEQLGAASGQRGGRLRGFKTARDLAKLFESLIEDRRLHPDDGLVSELVRAEVEGERLTHKETVAMVFLLLLAGHDTTANLIGSSVLALTQNREQLALLRQQPELLEGTALEELLRYTSPVPCGAPRIALQDCEIAGTPIPRGSQVLGMISSANRDESIFEEPDALDLTRKPNKHVTFAYGMHYCLGTHLARLEGRTALATLLRRFPNWEPTVPSDRLRYKPTVSLRGLTKLPIRMY